MPRKSSGPRVALGSFRSMLAGGAPPAIPLSGVLAAALSPALALVSAPWPAQGRGVVGLWSQELRDRHLGSSIPESVLGDS